MKHLSIIVPMYNVEPYVERCLRSLEDQDIMKDDYEIICVNDGSTDGSRAIVGCLQKEFGNIILINQENQGVARARNKGIDKACGKYLLYIDADDYVDSNRFAYLINTIEEKKAQILFMGYTIFNENGTTRKRILYEEYSSKIYTGIEAYYITHMAGHMDPDRTAAVLFETDFINRNNLRYTPDVPYLEDGELISRILCLAVRCLFDYHPFYNRRTRSGSATSSNLFNSEVATRGFLLAVRNLKKFQEDQNLSEKQREFLNLPICKFVVLVIDSASKPFSFKRIINTKKKLLESGLSKLRLESVDDEFTRLGHYYNKSVYVLIIYRFLQASLRFLGYRPTKQRSSNKHILMYFKNVN
jgi:glycosyltransferase involved in cell wall biosynthesis